MKRAILLVLCALFYGLTVAQIPQGFNYQAIARDGSGNILPNTSLEAMMYVQSLSTGGTIFWKELHSSVTTNSFGLFTLVVGTGVRQTESTVATFNLIDWSVTPKYLKTEIYYSSSWKDLGTSQLMSVPYAMTSGDLAGTVDKLSVKGTTSGLEDALFEVKNKDGQTVFAVYNEGVRIYVSDGAKAVKGGFAVGGFGTDKAESTKYLFVGKDSVRIYLDTNPLTKAVKSGFAVGGYDLTKGAFQNFLDVSGDSVRIYIDSDPSTKKLKGGFAVGGYDMTKGTNTNYMNVNTDANGIINPSQKRILWYPIKNAFLTGKILVENKDSVGENSFASGYESKAKGQYSQALGYKAIARGDYSTAIGKNAVANKINSFSFGDSVIASANNSYAFGKNSTAEGDGSYAFGYKATALGQDSYAFGTGTEAKGIGSFAFGFIGRDSVGNSTGNTLAISNYAVAIGMGAQASQQGAFSIGTISKSYGFYSTAIGYGAISSGNFTTSIGYKTNASYILSTALGYESIASGLASVSIGRRTNASGDNSTAIGIQTSASGASSTAIGSGNSAIGGASTAMGAGTTASGYVSTSMGQGTTASGDKSTSMGMGTIASGIYSTAMGNQTISKSYASLSIGHNNDETCTSATGWISTDPLFICGNGFMAPKSNALILYKNGNMTISGTLTQNSDLRMKTNISSLGEVLDKINKINPVYFDFKDQLIHPNSHQLGFIAQEILPLFPELVEQDSRGYLSVDYSKMSAVLLQAIKEQQHLIVNLQTKNDALEANNYTIIQGQEALQKEIDNLKSLINTLITYQADKGNK